MSESRDKHKCNEEDERGVNLPAEDGEEGAEEAVESYDAQAFGEEYSALRAEEMNEIIVEIRRMAESNGGYITYE